MQEKVDRYFLWEAATRSLCDAGAIANAWVDEVYAEGHEAKLLDPTSPQARTFARHCEPRHAYWMSRIDALCERLGGWIEEYEAERDAALEASDRLGVIRTVCWLRNSTLDIVRRARDVAPDHARRIEELAVQDIGLVPRAEATTYQVETSYESSSAFVQRHGRKLFGHIYRIERPKQRPRYAEVVETWQWSPLERMTLCLPMSIGCPNHCPMCEFGTYNAGDLLPEEVGRLIELNLARDRAVPISTDPKDMTLYYLGGGDACLYPHVRELLGHVDERYPGATQILSTIAVDHDNSLSALVDAAAEHDAVGLQVSLCSFDESVRRDCVGGVKVVPTARVLDELKRFHAKSGRKGYVSLFLLPERNDDAAQVRVAVNDAMDRDAHHVTFAVVRQNGLPFTDQRVSEATLNKLAADLRDDGFEVSVSTNDNDPENEVTCGRSHRVLLERNQPFFKRVFAS